MVILSPSLKVLIINQKNKQKKTTKKKKMEKKDILTDKNSLSARRVQAATITKKLFLCPTHINSAKKRERATQFDRNTQIFYYWTFF